MSLDFRLMFAFTGNVLQEAERPSPVGELPLFAGGSAGSGSGLPGKHRRQHAWRDRRLAELDRELAALQTYALVARNGRVREALRRKAASVLKRKKAILAHAAES